MWLVPMHLKWVWMINTKKQFWDHVDEKIQEIPIGEKVFVEGDFNSHVGSNRMGHERIHRGFGFGDQNETGKSILDFAIAFDLVTNTFYIKNTNT